MFRYLIVGLALLLAANSAPASVTITVLDVGQGDATLVQSSSGATLLFDGGPNGAGSGVILPYLSSLGITSLDYIVASHYHADHIGGLDEVINRTGATGGVWDRGWDYGTVTYSNYVSAAGSDRHTITDGQVFDLGDGVTATCIAVNGNGEVDPPYDSSTIENEYCIALLVECGDFDFFQAGDLIGTDDGSHVDIETGLAQELEQLGRADLEVYQVDHHGSDTASNASFLNLTTPEVAIISVGDNNTYGHPHVEPLQRMQSRDIFVYMTTPGNGATLPAEDMTIVGGHIVIETSGASTYTVDGDTWDMDEDSTVAATEPPAAFAMLGNAPNPFNPATVIAFSSNRGGPGQLEVFDLAGRRHWRESFVAPAGRFQLDWRGCDDAGRSLPSGVYVYRIAVPDGVGRGRMVLAR